MGDEGEFSWLSNGPAPPFKGQEIQIDLGNSDDFAKEVAKRERPLSDPQRILDALIPISVHDLPSVPPTPLPPPPVPQKVVPFTPPVESVPVAVVVQDTPALQGEAKADNIVIISVEPSKGPISPEVAPEYYWGIFDPSLPRMATDIIGRTNPPPATDFDFDALIRRTLRNEPAPGKPHPSHAKPSSRMPAYDGDPVDLFTGAFTVSATDLVVPTAYIPIELSRYYRSGRPYYGPFGFGWDHCYNVYLRELDDGSVALWTGQLSEQRFNFISGLFEPAPGFSARMEALPGLAGNYEVIYSGGRVWHFERPAGWTDTEQIPLVSIRDRHGNTVELTYSNLNKLASVLDTDGRGLFFHYGSCNLLEQVMDHTRTRVVSYWHETEAEHLAGVILPVSAQYPEGQTTSYEYDGYASHPAMQHNILRIRDAENRLVIENDYAGPETLWQFNTVIRQRSAKFEYQFEYQEIQYVWKDTAYIDTPASRTLVRPPDGSLHTYTFNYRGDLLDERCRLIRDGSYRVVNWQRQYDTEGNIIKITAPDGLQKFFTYDALNADPCSRRNLVKTELATPLPVITPSRIIYQAKYDPNYQLVTFTKDEQGAETRYFYDFDTNPAGTGLLRRILLPAVKDADGNTQQSELLFENNPQGQLTARVTAEGCRIEIDYFAAGITRGFLSSITTVSTAGNLITSFGYDSFGFPDEKTDWGLRRSTFRFNFLGQLEESNDPKADGKTATTRYWYDDSGGIVKTERPAGSSIGTLTSGSSIIDEYQRDEVGNVHTGTIASNTVLARQWLQCADHEGRVTAIWDGAGTRMNKCFGEDGSLLRETVAAGDAEEQITNYIYDRAGRVTKVTGHLKDSTLFRYDPWGRLDQVTLPSGATRKFIYGKNDLLLEDRTEEKLIPGQPGPSVLTRETFEYDKRGRLLTATVFSFRDDPSLAVPLKTTFFYDKDDRLTRVVYPLGAHIAYNYDDLGRLRQTTDMFGNLRQLVYNTDGDLGALTLTEVEGGITRTTTRTNKYDTRGRLISTISTGIESVYEYDDRDLMTEQSSTSGLSTLLQFDAQGQLIEKIIDPGGLGLRSQYQYDLYGHLNRYTDPMGRVTAWERDRLNRLKSVTPPDGTVWKFNIDVNAKNVVQTMPSGNNLAIKYFQDGKRPVGMQATPALGQQPVGQHQFEYDGLGRLLSASTTASSVTRKYDSLNRLIEETANGKSVRMEFDDTVGSADLIYPDGRQEQTQYNSVGQPTRIILVTPGILGGNAGDTLLDIIYSSAGRPVTLQYGNGVQGNLAYDDQGRIIMIEYKHGAVLLDSCRMRYDEAGHRAVVQYSGATQRNLYHVFDKNGRLTEARNGFPLPPLADNPSSFLQLADIDSAKISAAGASGISIALDDSDTRTAITGFGGVSGQPFISGSDHRLTQMGPDLIEYNKDGHRQKDERYIYELDALNRVRSIRENNSGVVVASLNYDALSRVASGTINGISFNRWFAGTKIIEEQTGGGPALQMTAHPLWPAPFCLTGTSGVSFFHHDDGWSIMNITDASGNIKERHRYDVFGDVSAFEADGVTKLPGATSAVCWRGMQALGDTKLYTTPKRIYDPLTGAFTSRDPLLYTDSPSPYVYAGANPVDYADPSGYEKTLIGNKANKPYEKPVMYWNEVTPEQQLNQKMDAIMKYDLPPDKTGFLGEDYFGYAFVYGLKQSIYKPIKAHWFNEKPKYLDKEGHVQTVPWKIDRMDAASAYAQIASFFIPAPKVPRVNPALPVAEATPAAVAEVMPDVAIGAAAVEEQATQVTAVVAETDPVLEAAAGLREGELFPEQFRGIRWKRGDPINYPVKGRYPKWPTVQQRIVKNAQLEGNPLPLDPISPYRGRVPIDHIHGQRFRGLDPHNPANLWVCDDWGWLEHAFFDPFAQGRDITGIRWLGRRR